MGLQVWNNCLYCGWEKRKHSRAKCLSSSPGGSPAQVRWKLKSSDILWRILRHNSCLGGKQGESWAFHRLGGGKKWFFDFTCFLISTAALCSVVLLVPLVNPSCTAKIPPKFVASDVQKHAASCQALRLSCQRTAFMSWTFQCVVSLQTHLPVSYSQLHYVRIQQAPFSCCNAGQWQHQERVASSLPRKRIGCRVLVFPCGADAVQRNLRFIVEVILCVAGGPSAPCWDSNKSQLVAPRCPTAPDRLCKRVCWDWEIGA